MVMPFLKSSDSYVICSTGCPVVFISVTSLLMNHDNVELVFCDADCLPEAFRKSKKGSIYLTPYRVRDETQAAYLLSSHSLMPT